MRQVAEIGIHQSPLALHTVVVGGELTHAVECGQRLLVESKARGDIHLDGGLLPFLGLFLPKAHLGQTHCQALVLKARLVQRQAKVKPHFGILGRFLKLFSETHHLIGAGRQHLFHLSCDGFGHRLGGHIEYIHSILFGFTINLQIYTFFPNRRQKNSGEPAKRRPCGCPTSTCRGPTLRHDLPTQLFMSP